jgi:Tfp pilus assembly protein PilZ
MDETDAGAGFPHREHPRWPVSIEVHVQAMGWDERMTLFTEDLSLGGAFIRTERTIQKGTYLQLTFCIPNRTDLLAFAEVVREVTLEQAAERTTSPGIGVQYLDPDPAFLDGMKSLVTELAGLSRSKVTISRPTPPPRPAASPAASRVASPAAPAKSPDTFEMSEEDYRAAADAVPGNEPTPAEDVTAITARPPDADDDWWAASVDQLNRHRILKRLDQGAFSTKEPVVDLGAELDRDADPQRARPDVEQALADFAASIGHTPEVGTPPDHAPPREGGDAQLPPPKLDRDAPVVFEAKQKGFLDLGKTIVLYDRCMKLIEAKSYASAHELAQELLAVQPQNKKFLVVLNLAAGGLYKSHGDLERATLHFQDAADLDETCKVAIEELRAVGMTRRQQTNVKSGLLAKLKEKNLKRTRG